MKKQTILSIMALALATAPAGVPSLTSAKQTVREETASATSLPDSEEFLQKYACAKKVVLQNQKMTETDVWFEKADAENYQRILDGEEIYSKLDEETRKKIDQAYADHQIDRKKLVEEAQKIKEQKEQEQKTAEEQSKATAADNPADWADQTTQTAPADPAALNTQTPAQAEQQPENSTPAIHNQPEPDNQGNLENTSKTQTPEANSPSEPDENQQQPAVSLPVQTPAADQKETKQEPSGSDPNQNQDQVVNQDPSQQSAQQQPEAGQEDPSKSKPENSSAQQPEQSSDQAENQLPAAYTQEELDAWHELYQEELRSGSTIYQLSVTGQIDPDEGMKEAASAFAESKGLHFQQLYRNVSYRAEGENGSATSALMAAMVCDEQLILFQPYFDQAANTYTLQEYSLKAISFDFVSGVLTPSITGSFTWTGPVPDPAEPAENENQNQNPEEENPDGRADIQKPDTETTEPETVLENTVLATIPAEQQNASMPESNVLGRSFMENVSEQLMAREKIEGSLQENMPEKEESTKTSSLLSQAAMNSAINHEGVLQQKTLQQSDVNLASAFVSQYLTGANGLVIKTADSSNYRQILQAFNAWKNYSANTRTQIDNMLKNQGAPYFGSLFVQANRVRLNLPPADSSLPRPNLNRVYTSAQSGWQVAAAAMAVSVAGACILFKKMKKDSAER